MLAFHGDKKVKAKYLKRVRMHAKADEIIKGTYWNYLRSANDFV